MAPLTERRAAGPIVAAGLALLAGLLLLWLSVPRTIAHAGLASSDEILSALSRGEAPPPEQLSAAIAGRRAALAWIDLPDSWIGMGSLYLALARRDGVAQKDRAALLDRSIGSFERGLKMAPSRPFGWAQFAQAHQLRDPSSGAVDRPLRMSARTGPLEPLLISHRVRIGYAARAALSPETAKLVEDEVRTWAANDAWRLADWARPHFALPWVRQALSGWPALERSFLVNYLRLPPR